MPKTSTQQVRKPQLRTPEELSSRAREILGRGTLINEDGEEQEVDDWLEEQKRDLMTRQALYGERDDVKRG